MDILPSSTPLAHRIERPPSEGPRAHPLVPLRPVRRRGRFGPPLALALILATAATFGGCDGRAMDGGAERDATAGAESGDRERATDGSPEGSHGPEAGDTAEAGREDAQSSSDRAAAADEFRWVRTRPLARGTVRNLIETSGDAEAEFRADLHPRTNGFVREILVDEGDAVSRGDVLARLEDEEERLDVATQELRIREIERELDRQDTVNAELERRVEQQRLLEERKEEELRRAIDVGEGILSDEELAVKRYEYEDAKVARTAAELALRQGEESVEVARVRLDLAKVDRDLASVRLANTEIRAPIDGAVSERAIRVGERVGPEAMAFHVVDTARLVVYAYVPQKEIRFLRLGQRVEARTDAIPGEVVLGEVRVINPVIRDGSVKLEVELDNADGKLRPGMFLTLRVVLDEHEDALLVPKKAVRHESGDSFFFVVRDGVAHRVDFRPGYRDRDSVEAIVELPADAAPGESKPVLALEDLPVVVRGQENLRDGTPVRTEAAAADSFDR